MLIYIKRTNLNSVSIRERSQVSGGEPITILRMRLLSLEKVGESVVGSTLEEVHLQMLLWEWRVGLAYFHPLAQV